MKVPALLVSFASVGLLPLLGACVISVGGSACSWNSIRGSGVEATVAREVPAFRRVHVAGSADVVARVGEAQRLSLRGDDNLLEYVETEVRGDTLHIGLRPGSYSFQRDMVVELGVPQLEALSISGSADVRVAGLQGAQFDVSVSGSGDVIAVGEVDRLAVSISGSGDLDLYGLHAREAQVSISGSGDVCVDVSERLSVQISGSGDVSYRGSPSTSAKISGSGSLHGS